MPIRYLTDWRGTWPSLIVLATSAVGLVVGLHEARSVAPLSSGARREIRVWVVVLGTTVTLIGIVGALDALTA